MSAREPDPDEAIEAYLDALLVELHASPRLTRRVLAEAESAEEAEGLCGSIADLVRREAGAVKALQR